MAASINKQNNDLIIHVKEICNYSVHDLMSGVS